MTVPDPAAGAAVPGMSIEHVEPAPAAPPAAGADNAPIPFESYPIDIQTLYDGMHIRPPMNSTQYFINWLVEEQGVSRENATNAEWIRDNITDFTVTIDEAIDTVPVISGSPPNYETDYNTQVFSQRVTYSMTYAGAAEPKVATQRINTLVQVPSGKKVKQSDLTEAKQRARLCVHIGLNVRIAAFNPNHPKFDEMVGKVEALANARMIEISLKTAHQTEKVEKTEPKKGTGWAILRGITGLPLLKKYEVTEKKPTRLKIFEADYVKFGGLSVKNVKSPRVEDLAERFIIDPHYTGSAGDSIPMDASRLEHHKDSGTLVKFAKMDQNIPEFLAREDLPPLDSTEFREAAVEFFNELQEEPRVTASDFIEFCLGVKDRGPEAFVIPDGIFKSEMKHVQRLLAKMEQGEKWLEKPGNVANLHVRMVRKCEEYLAKHDTPTTFTEANMPRPDGMGDEEYRGRNQKYIELKFQLDRLKRHYEIDPGGDFNALKTAIQERAEAEEAFPEGEGDEDISNLHELYRVEDTWTEAKIARKEARIQTAAQHVHTTYEILLDPNQPDGLQKDADGYFMTAAGRFIPDGAEEGVVGITRLEEITELADNDNPQLRLEALNKAKAHLARSRTKIREVESEVRKFVRARRHNRDTRALDRRQERLYKLMEIVAEEGGQIEGLRNGRVRRSGWSQMHDDVTETRRRIEKALRDHFLTGPL